jgi:NAD(P)-dependent dehydrogenase (short-subunit alcohol dehydrogenase family)
MSNNNHPISVQDKVILVTGATGLIGKELSYMLLKNGAKVILADINEQAFEPIRAEIISFADENSFLLCRLDITNEGSIEHCIAQSVSKFSRIDVLINNAAIDAKFDKTGTSGINNSRFENYPIELLKRSIDVNMTGTIQMTQHACRQMLKQGYGNIINIASTYSLVAPNQSLYDFGDGKDIKFKPVDYIATKSFIPNYTRYLATFYANEGIRSNAIVPHGIFNDHDEAFQKNFARLSPMGRMSDRSELNGAFMLLCSDASSYMTGSVLVVDGGWTAW